VAALALGVVFAMLLAYMLIAAVAVFFVAVELAQALGDPVVASVGACLAIGGVLANRVLKMSCDQRAVRVNCAPSPKSADLIGNGTAVCGPFGQAGSVDAAVVETKTACGGM